MRKYISRSGGVRLLAVGVALVMLASVAFAGAAALDVTSADIASPDTTAASGPAVSSDDVSIAQSDDPAVNRTERTVESDTLRPGATTTVEMTVVMEEGEYDLGSLELVELEETFSPAFADVEAVEVTPGGGSSGSGPDNVEFYAVWNEQALTYSVTYEVTVPETAADGDQYTLSGSFSAGDVQISLPSETITASTDATGLELQPSDTTVPTEEQAVFDVVATGADSGVGSYSLTVSSSEPNIGKLADVSVTGQPDTDNSSVAVGGASALIEADLGSNDFAGAEEIVLAELTVNTSQSEGATDLTFDDGATVSDGTGTAYSLDYTERAALNVLDLDPAFFEISEFSIPGKVEVGSSFDVSATVTNTGEVTDTKDVRLLIDGTAETTQSVTLDAGASESVVFSDITLDTLGTYEVTIETDDENVSRTVSVEEDVGPPAVVGQDPPRDLNGDGLFEDVNGDGQFDIFDIQDFFTNFNSDVVQNNGQYFNFDGDANNEVSIFDVQALFTDLQTQGSSQEASG